jgi:hypothetical protein
VHPEQKTKEVFMLKHTIVCVMLVAASAMAWLPLKDVPHEADVDSGAHLVWGDGRIWGVFPSNNPSMTYLFTYDASQDPWNPVPDSCRWDTLQVMSAARLSPCNITFQPGEKPTLWGIGKAGTNPGISFLKHYLEETDEWVEDTINQFELGDGAGIAYAPNPAFDSMTYPVPGYLYCLVGGESNMFWRYPVAVAGLPDTAVYGYLYPDSGANTADLTPTFRWDPTGSMLNRIQVSTSPTFMSNVIDAVVDVCEYESPIELNNGTYYWRTAVWIGGQWRWCAAANDWFALEGGWLPCMSLDTIPGRGAEIAYDAGSFDDGEPGILAIYGRYHNRFSRYIIEANGWQTNTWDTTPHPVLTGSSLTTSALVEGAFPYHIDALFYDQQENSYPYIFDHNLAPDSQWQEFILDSIDPDWDTGLPDDIEVGSSMIIGDSSYSYLVTGHSNYFYRVEPEGFARGGGEQGREMAHVTRSQGANAQVITAHDGIEVEYQLPAAARVRAVLHDALGRRVGMLDAGVQKPGMHRLGWTRDNQGRKLSAGAYFVLLDMGSQQASLKALAR